MRRLFLVFAVIAVILGSAPAASSVTGTKTRKAGKFYYVTQTQTTGPGGISAFPSCPTGTATTGAGGAIGGGTSSKINEAGPGDPTFVTFGGYDGTGSATTLVATAVCLRGPTAGDVVYTNHPQSVGANSGLEAIYGCGGGQNLLGGGVLVSPNSSDQSMSVNAPTYGAGTTWKISGFTTAASTWTLYTACIPTADLHVKRVTKSAVVYPNKITKIHVSCPAHYRASAGGWGGDFVLADVSQPANAADGSAGGGWTVALSTQGDPQAGTAYVICAR